MKQSIVILAVCLTLSILSVSLVHLNKSQAVQSLQVIPQVQDFGAVSIDENDKSVAGFNIVNSTDEDISITQVRTSCTCSELKLQDRTVVAGGRVSAQLIATSSGLRGRRSITAVITTDSASFPKLTLTAVGEFYSGRPTNDFVIDLPPGIPGQALEFRASVPIIRSGVEAVSSKDLEECIGVKHMNSNARGDGNIYSELVFSGEYPKSVGSSENKIQVKLIGIEDEVSAKVRVIVVPRYEHKSELNFGVVRYSSIHNKVFRITDRKGVLVDSVELKSTTPDISLISHLIDNSTVDLIVGYAPKFTKGLISETIELSVSSRDGSVECLSIPVMARVVDDSLPDAE